MPISNFSRLTLGTGLAGTDLGDGEIELAATGSTTTVANDTIWDAKGDLAAATGANAAAKLPAGTNGQVLTADSTQTTGIKWAAAPGSGGGMVADTLWDAKGDLAVASAADTGARLAVGSNNQVLTADSTQTLGVKWATAAAGAIAVLFDSTLGASAATIDTGAGGVAAGYASLRIVFVGRCTEVATFGTCRFRFNADTGANYDRQLYQTNQTTVTAAQTLAQTGLIFDCPGTTFAANFPVVIQFDIPNYAGTVFYKGMNAVESLPSSTAGQFYLGQYSIGWRNTAAISRVEVASGANNLLTGSRLTILGIGA